MSMKMMGYKSEISCLRKEISTQKKKLDDKSSTSTSAATVTRGPPKVSSDGRIGKKSLQTYGKWEMSNTGFDPLFVNTQLRQDLESNSEEVQVIENPDLTTGAGEEEEETKEEKGQRRGRGGW